MSEDLLTLISCFMNACYSHCYVPESLLYGDIDPNIKDAKGNATESSNYRPVMRSSCLLKLFEMQLLEIISEKIFFNVRQFGYRKHTSTSDACLILKETISKYIAHKNCKSYGLFVDLSKAFDNVDHFLLGKLLLQRKIPPDIVLLLMHYLRNQYARVVWNGEKGDYCIIEKGVRQGGILSPLLFKLYIDDIINDVCVENVGCKFGILRMNILAYADDIVLLASSKEQLDKLYRVLEQRIGERKLLINKTKSKCLIFTNQSSNVTATDVILGNDIFEVVKEYKYLGHNLQDNLSDVKDVEFRLNSFYFKFYWLFRNFKNISIDVFILFLIPFACQIMVCSFGTLVKLQRDRVPKFLK